MARYTTTHQYEPLRTPGSWNAEERRLIVQLTALFDDIYRRYGRLDIKDVNASFQSLLNSLRHDVDENSAGVSALGIQKVNTSDVVNTLTEEAVGKVLDARQGKMLDKKKLDKSSIINTLTETAVGKGLDARQGKVLNEKKLDKTDVVSSLTETAPGKALDATQAAALLLAAWPVGSVYMSVTDTAPGFGGTWEQRASAITGVYLWERTA